MATPYAMLPQRLPTIEEMLGQFMPAPGSAPTPGGMMQPPDTPMPRAQPSLRALLAGMAAPLGFAPPVETVAQVPTLSGAETTPSLIQGMDLGAVAAEDPAGAAIGQSIGLGPAFRAAGAVAGSPPVQALGRQLARPVVQAGVTAPLAVGGAALATAGDTQAPTPSLGPRTTEAQTALDDARRRLRALETRRAGLQTRIDRYDPENVVRLSPDQIKEAQEALGATVDGKLGPQTRGVIAEYRRRLQMQIEGLTPSEAAIKTDIGKAETRRTEAERLDLQAEGGRRMREAEPGTFERLAPWLGLPAGLASGYALRRGLGSHTRRQVTSQADEAQRLASQFGEGDVPTRVGRLNQFWAGGSPRTAAPPFPFVPGATPYPWTSAAQEVRPGMMGGSVQRDVLAADQLYRPSLGTRMGPTATTMGLGAIEGGIGHFGGAAIAPMLAEAEAAANREPTEANIQRLQRLRTWATSLGFSERMGLGTALGGLYGAAKHPMRGLPRPDVMAAEAERGAVDMLLHPRPTVPPMPTPPAGPQPVWDPNIRRWRLNGGFVSAPAGQTPPAGQAPLSLRGGRRP